MKNIINNIKDVIIPWLCVISIAITVFAIYVDTRIERCYEPTENGGGKTWYQVYDGPIIRVTDYQTAFMFELWEMGLYQPIIR